MTRHSEHLARYYTAAIENAACKDTGTWWTQQEAAHAAARTADDAADATRAAFALCSMCPDKGLCAARAEADRYTGLAAGQVWLNGRAIPATTVMPPPQQEHPTAAAS